MNNPWETGVEYAGHRPAWCSAEDRILALGRMDGARLKACLEWPDTQRTVKAAIERRLRKLAKLVTCSAAAECQAAGGCMFACAHVYGSALADRQATVCHQHRPYVDGGVRVWAVAAAGR